MLPEGADRCGGAGATTAQTRSRLGSLAPLRALAEPELSAGTWCPSVYLRGCLPTGTAGWGGGAEREKRGRRPPSKAAQVPGCWSLSRQAGAGALEYLISRQVEDKVAAAISGQPLGLRVRGSCSRNSRRGAGAARL